MIFYAPISLFIQQSFIRCLLGFKHYKTWRAERDKKTKVCNVDLSRGMEAWEEGYLAEDGVGKTS